ncbi:MULTISPECIES: metallophosphoesterase [Methanoculleus]|nr:MULTISPECIES: metallophosphoesterase [Methanoculleus]MCC7554542.1 metallophosphoesterase [Methanoculleus marisnigri]UYU19675.1 metallophosphoesterase [Methanoculleus submarinus]
MAILMLIVLPSMTGYMAWEARAVEVTVLDIEGAPEGIVYITDPHVRASNIDHVREVIDEVNRLNPSLVLIGGDFVTGEEEDFASQEVWNSLDAPAYAVLGNHDYRVGIDGPTGIERTLATRASAVVTADAYDVSALNDGSADTAFADNLTAALEENGVRVLRNDYVRTSVGNEEIVIVGVDDGWAGMADPPDVPATDAFTVYLVHEPSCRADWDADLILAGHTHGGQFLFPVVKQLNDFGVIELAGLFDGDGRTPTYISRGVCTSSVAGVELRFNCQPEIVLINPTGEQLRALA